MSSFVFSLCDYFGKLAKCWHNTSPPAKMNRKQKFWATSNLKIWRSSEHMMKSQMNVFDDFCKFGGLACKLSPCCFSVPPLRQVPAMQKWHPKIAPNRLRHSIKQSHGIATGHENLIPPYPTSQMQSCCTNNLYSYPPSVGKTCSLVWYGFKTCQFSEG